MASAAVFNGASNVQPMQCIRYQVQYKALPRDFDLNKYLSMNGPTVAVQQEFVIREPLNTQLRHDLVDMSRVKNITPQDQRFLLDHLWGLIHDPVTLFSHLLPLEKIITRKLEERGISFSEDDDPSYVIALKGMCMPGLPVTLKKTEHVLSEALLEMARTFGLNENGLPTFVGFVDPRYARELIKSGYLFKEDAQISRMTLHGKFTHPILMLAWLESLKTTRFAHLTGKEILNFLIDCKFVRNKEETASAWSALFDQVGEQARANSTTPSQQVFSCSSPFVMNGELLTNFAHYGLFNLGRTLRNSHAKQILRMFSRLPFAPYASIRKVYDCITMELDRIAERCGDVGTSAIFSPSKMQVYHKKYDCFPLATACINVRQKIKVVEEPLPTPAVVLKKLHEPTPAYVLKIRFLLYQLFKATSSHHDEVKKDS